MPSIWRKEEYELLQRTGSVPGRSVRSIREAWTRLKRRNRRAPRPKWSQEQLTLLRQYREQGLSAAQIATTGTLPHSQNAIQKKLGRLGATARRTIVKFNAEQREMLRTFLRQNWERKTPHDLMLLWNDTHPKLRVNVIRISAYLQQLKLKIHYGEVQSINKLRAKEKKVIAKLQARGAAPADIDAELRKIRMRVMRKRLSRGRDIWSGIHLADDALTAETDETSAE